MPEHRAEVIRRTPETNSGSPTGPAGPAHDGARAETEGRGLAARLRRVIDDHARALRFAPRICFQGPLDEVPADAVTDLERVLDEALTNIASHARASCASVIVHLSGDVLTVRITDDGIGCAGAPTDGGLADLRRRASWYGGDLFLEPGPSGGTRLTWTVPLSPPDTLL